MKYILLLLCILLVDLASGCKGDNILDGTPESKNIAFTTIIHDSFEMSNDTNFITTVLRSKQEEEALVVSHLPFIPYTPYFKNKLSTVDYRQSMVVCILLGRQGSGSISVTIDSILQQGVTWEVYAHTFYPCVMIDMCGNPVHFVTLPRSAVPIVFSTIPIIKECGG